MKDAATGNKYYYHYDGLGSVMNLTDLTGAVAESYSYDAYGNITSPLSTVGNSYYFTGRQYDNETGLYYYRARYYDPKIGRFLQTDPIGYRDELNPYTYVKNNPVNWTDPYGLFQWHGCWGGPNWSGCQEKPLEELTPEERRKLPGPQDKRDRCYKEHDYCYANVVKGTCKGSKKRDKYLDNCDKQLARCLRRLKESGQGDDISWLEIWFFESGSNTTAR